MPAHKLTQASHGGRGVPGGGLSTGKVSGVTGGGTKPVQTSVRTDHPPAPGRACQADLRLSALPHFFTPLLLPDRAGVQGQLFPAVSLPTPQPQDLVGLGGTA